MSRRTALWYSPVADIGGVARHVLDAAAVGVPGWRLVVLCPEGPLAERLREHGVPVVTGPVGPEHGARTAIGEVRRVLKRLRPQVLHTHLAFADIAGVAAATGLRSGTGERIRIVSSEHGIAGVRGYYQSSTAQATVKAAVHRARLLRTDRVIAVSASTREQVLAQWGHGAEVTVIRNGVDPVEGSPMPGLRILSLSRLAREKRIDQLIAAFGQLLTEHPEARLTIAGDGPERATLEAQAAPLGEAVQFVGVVDASSALAEHDVVVQLSDWENLSYTLLDAVAHGLGVVATDVGGNAEIVPARCLVDAHDAPAVARAIAQQGLQVDQRPESGNLTTVQEMTEQIARVYQEVTA